MLRRPPKTAPLAACLGFAASASLAGTPPADPLADPNADNFVGFADLNAVLGNWNTGTPPAANAVPEPASLLALSLAALRAARRPRA